MLCSVPCLSQTRPKTWCGSCKGRWTTISYTALWWIALVAEKKKLFVKDREKITIVRCILPWLASPFFFNFWPVRWLVSGLVYCKRKILLVNWFGLVKTNKWTWCLCAKIFTAYLVWGAAPSDIRACCRPIISAGIDRCRRINKFTRKQSAALSRSCVECLQLWSYVFVNLKCGGAEVRKSGLCPNIVLMSWFVIWAVHKYLWLVLEKWSSRVISTPEL